MWMLHTIARAVFGIVFLILAPVTKADTLIMPRELVNFAESNGCKSIDDFFERPGMVNPPFMYGVFAGEPEQSAALWCKKMAQSEKPYALLIKVADTSVLRACPAKIDWWNTPGGLSMESRNGIELKYFRYVDEPEQHGPTVTIDQADLIVNYYDGLTDLFYCYDGRWLVISSD